MNLLLSSLTIGLVIAFILFAFSFLVPSATVLPQGFIDSIGVTVGYVNAYSWFFPFHTLITVMFTIMFFEAAVLTFKVVFWFIRTIRGTSS